MAIVIRWSDEAVKTFDDNINYLISEWSENEIRNFIKQTNQRINSKEITEEIEWWKDKGFVKELDRRYNAWETGKEKGYTLEEVDALFEIARKKRSNK